MSDVVIRVENLSKQYRIGGPQAGYKTIRESLTEAVGAPFRRLSSVVRGQSSAVANETIWALKDVSFEVKRGEVVGIIGRNGAGKTTLLKILSRITEPTEGHAEIHGRVGSLLEVGTGFHPELTGRENITLNGAILGMKRAEIDRKFDEIVDFAEIEKFMDTPVKHYSSGMYVRLAFAVAAHLEPEILLVDEVLAVGDIEFQKKCIGKMEEVAGEGRTVVVVSHSMATIKALCSRAILLERGAIRVIGPVDAVVAEYLGAHRVDVAERIIGDDDHLPGGHKIRAKRVRLLNGVQNSFSVYWLQPISVFVEIEVVERAEDVIFGAGIRTVDGSYVFSVNSDINHNRIQPGWTLEPGRYAVKFVLRNELRPGVYKLSCGAVSRGHLGRSHLFSVGEAATLEILDFSEDGATPRLTLSGMVNGYSNWETPERLQ